jgi:hypothetical protein
MDSNLPDTYNGLRPVYLRLTAHERQPIGGAGFALVVSCIVHS